MSTPTLSTLSTLSTPPQFPTQHHSALSVVPLTPHDLTTPSLCTTDIGPVVLYTDIPFLTRIIRCLGHVGVTNYNRTKYFEVRAWPFFPTTQTVWVLEGGRCLEKPILFGFPSRYLPLKVPPEYSHIYDYALEMTAIRWGTKRHMGILSNCHSFICEVLNIMHKLTGGDGNPFTFLGLGMAVFSYGLPIQANVKTYPSILHRIRADFTKLWMSIVESGIGISHAIQPEARRQLNRFEGQCTLPLWLHRLVEACVFQYYSPLEIYSPATLGFFEFIDNREGGKGRVGEKGNGGVNEDGDKVDLCLDPPYNPQHDHNGGGGGGGDDDEHMVVRQVLNNLVYNNNHNNESSSSTVITATTHIPTIPHHSYNKHLGTYDDFGDSFQHINQHIMTLRHRQLEDDLLQAQKHHNNQHILSQQHPSGEMESAPFMGNRDDGTIPPVQNLLPTSSHPTSIITHIGGCGNDIMVRANPSIISSPNTLTQQTIADVSFYMSTQISLQSHNGRRKKVVGGGMGIDYGSGNNGSKEGWADDDCGNGKRGMFLHDLGQNGHNQQHHLTQKNSDGSNHPHHRRPASSSISSPSSLSSSSSSLQSTTPVTNPFVALRYAAQWAQCHNASQLEAIEHMQKQYQKRARKAQKDVLMANQDRHSSNQNANVMSGNKGGAQHLPNTLSKHGGMVRLGGIKEDFSGDDEDDDDGDCGGGNRDDELILFSPLSIASSLLLRPRPKQITTTINASVIALDNDGDDMAFDTPFGTPRSMGGASGVFGVGPHDDGDDGVFQNHNNISLSIIFPPEHQPSSLTPVSAIIESNSYKQYQQQKQIVLSSASSTLLNTPIPDRHLPLLSPSPSISIPASLNPSMESASTQISTIIPHQQAISRTHYPILILTSPTAAPKTQYNHPNTNNHSNNNPVNTKSIDNSTQSHNPASTSNIGNIGTKIGQNGCWVGIGHRNTIQIANSLSTLYQKLLPYSIYNYRPSQSHTDLADHSVSLPPSYHNTSKPASTYNLSSGPSSKQYSQSHSNSRQYLNHNQNHNTSWNNDIETTEWNTITRIKGHLAQNLKNYNIFLKKLKSKASSIINRHTKDKYNHFDQSNHNFGINIERDGSSQRNGYVANGPHRHPSPPITTRTTLSLNRTQNNTIRNGHFLSPQVNRHGGIGSCRRPNIGMVSPFLPGSSTFVRKGRVSGGSGIVVDEGGSGFSNGPKSPQRLKQRPKPITSPPQESQPQSEPSPPSLLENMPEIPFHYQALATIVNAICFVTGFSRHNVKHPTINPNQTTSASTSTHPERNHLNTLITKPQYGMSGLSSEIRGGRGGSGNGAALNDVERQRQVDFEAFYKAQRLSYLVQHSHRVEIATKKKMAQERLKSLQIDGKHNSNSLSSATTNHRPSPAQLPALTADIIEEIVADLPIDGADLVDPHTLPIHRQVMQEMDTQFHISDLAKSARIWFFGDHNDPTMATTATKILIINKSNQQQQQPQQREVERESCRNIITTASQNTPDQSVPSNRPPSLPTNDQTHYHVIIKDPNFNDVVDWVISLLLYTSFTLPVWSFNLTLSLSVALLELIVMIVLFSINTSFLYGTALLDQFGTNNALSSLSSGAESDANGQHHQTNPPTLPSPHNNRSQTPIQPTNSIMKFAFSDENGASHLLDNAIVQLLHYGLHQCGIVSTAPQIKFGTPQPPNNNNNNISRQNHDHNNNRSGAGSNHHFPIPLPNILTQVPFPTPPPFPTPSPVLIPPSIPSSTSTTSTIPPQLVSFMVLNDNHRSNTRNKLSMNSITTPTTTPAAPTVTSLSTSSNGTQSRSHKHSSSSSSTSLVTKTIDPVLSNSLNHTNPFSEHLLDEPLSPSQYADLA